MLGSSCAYAEVSGARGELRNLSEPGEREATRARCQIRSCTMGALLAAALLSIVALTMQTSIRHSMDKIAGIAGVELKAEGPPPPLGSPRGRLWCNQGLPEQAMYPPFAPLPNLWRPAPAGPAIQVKALTYNLYWWHLFQELNSGVTAARLVADTGTGSSTPYDAMAFQECEDVNLVLSLAGLSEHYSAIQGHKAMCMAYRTKAWSLVANGQEAVAEDTHDPDCYYGRRCTVDALDPYCNWQNLAVRESSRSASEELRRALWRRCHRTQLVAAHGNKRAAR